MIRPKLRMRLGDLLVEESIISEGQLSEALASQKKTGRKLGAALIDLGVISEDQLLSFLSQQLNVPFIDISQKRIAPAVAQLLPEVHARRYRALVIEDNGDHVQLGMSDPGDLSVLDAITPLLAPKRVEIAVVKESQLLEAFDNLYRRTADIASFAQQLGEEYDESDDFSLDTLAEDESEATVAKLLKSIFEDAVQARASDIHLEPDEGMLRIRQRVDGMLQENIVDEAKISAALVLRLKLMASLDISEKRVPQDGRFNIKVRGNSIDIRISTMPVQYGESVVMRLLNQSSGILALEETGMPGDIMVRFRNILNRPNGMILVTGPTGSGKTTTLYGALSEMNQAEKKIITVEDPVEYRLPRINQVQVNPKIGLTFGSVLRATLRQDPDIILVGEMRDDETVEIGLRGALTGHLVLSTLHTNDAISTAIRLIDMGAPSYLVASSLRGVLAQRLVRKICPNCAMTYRPDQQENFWLENLEKGASTNFEYKRGAGCQSCNYAGYKGRVGVFELLEMNEGMMNALKRGDTEQFAVESNKNKGFVPLAKAALDYAKDGVTTVEEVLKLVELVVDTSGSSDELADELSSIDSESNL